MGQAGEPDFHEILSVLPGSGGLSKCVTTGDNWADYVASRGSEV